MPEPPNIDLDEPEAKEQSFQKEIESFHPPLLPQLTGEPQSHPDSCLSFSLPLLRAVHELLPAAPDLTLSIGSGSGLVESLLQTITEPYSLNLVGVEVMPSPNKYLPPTSHRCVQGTWALDPLSKAAKAWLFVYPKRVGLIEEYLNAHKTDGVQTVVWNGPRRDWEEFSTAFATSPSEDIELWDEERIEAAGGRAWECIAIVRYSDCGK
ncbi:hypothetical protein PM082_000831 [Marasmius tenuissimus]|nr:hypothetical protein PM082_000831 [Marasmius tenuissimus]